MLVPGDQSFGDLVAETDPESMGRAVAGHLQGSAAA